MKNLTEREYHLLTIMDSVLVRNHKKKMCYSALLRYRFFDSEDTEDRWAFYSGNVLQFQAPTAPSVVVGVPLV